MPAMRTCYSESTWMKEATEDRQHTANTGIGGAAMGTNPEQDKVKTSEC